MARLQVNYDILNQKGSPAIYASSLATRPAFGFVGRIFIDTDNPSTGIYRDTGSSWIQVAAASSGASDLQAVTTAGNTTNTGITITANGLGIGTAIPASNRIDIHSASGLQGTFNGTGTTNAGLQLQSAGVGKWTLQNNYNSAANDFAITDVLNSLNRLTIKNTGQTFIGTSTTSSGLFVVNSATGDNHIVIIGANAPSLRFRNAGSGGTLNTGIGISTATNNFIQGSVSGDYCLFNSSTTASPILLGIYDSGSGNTVEAARISAARNLLVGTTIDGGYKLSVLGTANISGALTGNSASFSQLIRSTKLETLNSETDYLQLSDDTNGLRISNYYSISGIRWDFNRATTQLMSFAPGSNNVLINTTTDNGYKLDVNGNTNITGNLNVTGTITGTTTSPTLTYTPGGNFIQFVPFTGTQVTVNNYTTTIDGISGFFIGTGTITGDLTTNIKNIVSFGTNSTFPSSVTGSLNFTNLKNFIGGTSSNVFNPFATVGYNFPLLEYVSPGVSLSGGSVTTIDFSSLKICEGTFTFSSFTNITTATFPSLQTINRGLINTTGLSLSINPSLTSFSIPSIINILTSTNSGNAIVIQVASLTTFSLPTTLKRVQGNVLITNAALTQASVDNILVRLAGLDGTAGTTLYNSPTVTITGTSATPSATGLAAKAILQARGITVTTN